MRIELRRNNIVVFLAVLILSAVIFSVFRQHAAQRAAPAKIAKDKPLVRTSSSFISSRTRQNSQAIAKPRVHAPTLRGVNLEKLGKEFNSLSSVYSGDELRKRQLDYLSELSSSQTLSLDETLQLVNELYYMVPDFQLSAAWSILLPSILGRAEFNFKNIVPKLPEGRLATDLLAQYGRDLPNFFGKGPTSEDLELLKNSVDGESYNGFLKSYAQSMALIAPQEAIAFALKYRTDLGSVAFSGVVQNLGVSAEYEKLKEVVLGSGSPDQTDMNLVNGFTSGWTNASPAAAAQWVQGLQDQNTKSFASGVLMSKWAETDLTGATKWLASTDLVGMDPAIAVVARRLARYSPSEARQWGEQIGDSKLKEEVLRNIKDK